MAIPALNVAVTGLQIAEKDTQVHANNIANLKTPGFKTSVLQTSDLFYTTLKKAGAIENTANGTRRPVGAQLGSGARINGVYRVLEQGTFKNTGQALDIALRGPGYFAIITPNFPNGRGYTRNGMFHLDPDSRMIVTANGDHLDGDYEIPNGVEADKINISPDGIISYDDGNGGQPEVGQIHLYTFPNEKGLEAVGNDMLVETPGSGEGFEIADLSNKFLHKALEESTTSSVRELTELIASQRAYELNTRVVKVADEMEKEISSIKS